MLADIYDFYEEAEQSHKQKKRKNKQKQNAVNQPGTDALAMTTSLKLSLQRCCNRFVALGLVCFVGLRRGRRDTTA